MSFKASVSDEVMSVFKSLPGQRIRVSDLMASTGYSNKQIRNSIYYLTTKNGVNVRQVDAQTFVYNDPAEEVASPPPTDEAVDTVYVWVGNAKDGDVIVRGESTNTLYILSELEIN